MGILGYPNMDDDNQDGVFGDYSDIYSNYSEEKGNAAFADDDTAEPLQDAGLEVEPQPDVVPQGMPQEQQEDALESTEPIAGQKKSNLMGYILVLGALLIAAAGMFFYKQHNEQAAPSQDQAMGDYFYDKAAADATAQSQSEQTATVDVDLTTPAENTPAASEEKPAEAVKAAKEPAPAEESSDKPMSAIEKAMLKKKMDAQKESQVGLSSRPVIIPVSAGGRVDPFVPYLQAQALANTSKFELIAPPTVIPEADPVVDELVETKISGIMYDSARPSAIVNFGGADQLVHKGDLVKGYKILNITKNSVVIKYKTNIYQATVGQTLNEGVNLNPVSNLSNQFGGAYSKTTGNVIQFNN